MNLSVNGVYRMVCKKTCIIISLIALLTSCSGPTEQLSQTDDEAKIINKKFSFTLLTSDVVPWAEGQREGIVGPEKGKHALFLERLIGASRSEIMFGLYGVQAQPWFFSAIGLEESRKVSIVVDQQSGALNEWVPENFNYPDTAILGQNLDEETVVPDQNSSGTPRTSSIMHNKFMVLKNKGVWTGSTNVSSTCLGSEYNANASIYIASPEIAAVYEQEFRQMFEEKKFSIYKDVVSRKALSYRDGTKVNVYFSPQDQPIETAIIPFIDSAKKTLDIGMFVLSHPDVISALAAAAERGVKVRLIGDALFFSRDISPLTQLRNAGVDARIENWGGKMHIKAAVADRKTTVIGSMNWTKAGGEGNDENTLVIKNAKLAKEFGEYFDNLWLLLDNVGSNRPIAESLSSINSCFDGIDNDYDGLIDADEPLCQGAGH